MFHGPVGLNPYWWLFRLFQPRGPFWEFSGLVAKYGHGIESPEQVRERYTKHNESIRGYLKQHKRSYLEYDVAQGWEPLCEFLDKEAPKSEAFPRLNDSATFQEDWKPFLADVTGDIHRKMALLLFVMTGVFASAAFYYHYL